MKRDVKIEEEKDRKCVFGGFLHLIPNLASATVSL